jgi:hypothetical protein
MGPVLLVGFVELLLGPGDLGLVAAFQGLSVGLLCLPPFAIGGKRIE